MNHHLHNDKVRSFKSVSFYFGNMLCQIKLPGSTRSTP
jgi:hypothetical protein